MTTIETQRWSPRTTALIALALITLIAVAPAIALWLNRDQFPDQIATHWGLNGQPDTWQSFSGALVSGALLSLVFPLLILGLGAALRQVRELAAFAIGMAAFMSALSLGTTWWQGRDSQPPIGLVVVAALALWAVVGALAAWVLLRWAAPNQRRQGAVGTPSTQSLHVSDSTRVAWTGPVRVGAPGMWAGGIIVALLVALGVTIMVVMEFWIGMVVLASALVVLVAFATLLSQVTIDHRGLAVRVLGVPVISVPIADVTSVGTTTVDPLGDYGGWGYRVGLDGRSIGVVHGRGEALVAGRRGKKDLVIAMDGAEQAGLVLNTLRDLSSRAHA